MGEPDAARPGADREPGPALAVTLRPWRPSDRDDLAALANDRRVSINLRDVFPFPYTADDAERFIAFANGMVPQTNFAIDASGRLAGGVGYSLHQDVERVAAEVGYWIGVPFWGRGIATEAVRQVTALAFSNHPDLRRLYALPFATNAASARVLEKAGYRREAVLRQSVIKEGVVQDQWLYAILRHDATGSGAG
jgi:RimJ/RimL family protein N-acetyltransferase